MKMDLHLEFITILYLYNIYTRTRFSQFVSDFIPGYENRREDSTEKV